MFNNLAEAVKELENEKPKLKAKYKHKAILREESVKAELSLQFE